MKIAKVHAKPAEKSWTIWISKKSNISLKWENWIMGKIVSLFNIVKH